MITYLQNIIKQQTNRQRLIVTFIVGVLLVIVALPIEFQKEESVDTSASKELESVETGYKNELEAQVEEILSQVEGVGEVKVLVTYESTGEKVVEKDTVIGEETKEEATIFEDSEYGQTPYVTKELYPKIEGVLVIASGGGDSIVVENITEAIQALFEVDTHKIKIMKMKSSQKEEVN